MHHEIRLMDCATKRVFYDKLTFIYLEMPKFHKTEAELETNFARGCIYWPIWKYWRSPPALQSKIFEKAFAVAEIARYTPAERHSYEESLKVYRDLIDVVETARQKGMRKGEEKGRKEGFKEGLEQVVRNAIAQGLSTEPIVDLTGLTTAEIETRRAW